jgi:hypothetical protein
VRGAPSQVQRCPGGRTEEPPQPMPPPHPNPQPRRFRDQEKKAATTTTTRRRPRSQRGKAARRSEASGTFPRKRRQWAAARHQRPLAAYPHLPPRRWAPGEPQCRSGPSPPHHPHTVAVLEQGGPLEHPTPHPVPAVAVRPTVDAARPRRPPGRPAAVPGRCGEVQLEAQSCREAMHLRLAAKPQGRSWW